MAAEFGGQEPGDSKEVLNFARNYRHAHFDLFQKIDVNGPKAHPLYRHLLGRPVSGNADDECADHDSSCKTWAQQDECVKNSLFMYEKCRLSCKLCKQPEGEQHPIGWNFEAFLLDRHGQVHKRWQTGIDLTGAAQRREIEQLLDEDAGPILITRTGKEYRRGPKAEL